MEEYSKDELQGIDRNNRPYRVLVIDDEPGVRKLVTQILRSASYEVCGEAEDGIQGTAKYKILNPDIVTLDVKMPLKDGYETLKDILEHDPNAIVVMLTFEAAKSTVFPILQAGAKDYVLKPIKRDKLLQKIRAVRRDTTLSTSNFKINIAQEKETQEKDDE